MERNAGWKAKIAMIVLAVATSMLIGSAAAAQDMTTYVDPAGQFTFMLPDGYVSENPGALGLGLLSGASPAAFFSPNFADAGVGIRVVANDSRQSPPVMVAWGALNDAVRQQMGATAVDPFVQGTVLGDAPAVRIDYSYTGTSARMRLQQVAVQHGNALYVLTFSARAADFDAFYEEIKTVLNSFTFLDTVAP